MARRNHESRLWIRWRLARQCPRAGAAGRGNGVRLRVDARDTARFHTRGDAGGGKHDEARSADERDDRLPAQPHGARHGGVGHPAPEQGAIRARPGQPGEGPQHQPLQHRVAGRARHAHEGIHPHGAGGVGVLHHRQETRIRRQVLPLHAPDAELQSRARSSTRTRRSGSRSSAMRWRASPARWPTW